MTKLLTSFTALLCGLLLVGTAKADYAKGVTGNCQLTISGKPMPCGPRMAFINERGQSSVVITAMGINTFFQGGRDIQPDLNHYSLFVDSVKKDVGGARIPAKGRCDSTINDSGSRIFSQHCSVTLNTGLHFDFSFTPTSDVVDIQ